MAKGDKGSTNIIELSKQNTAISSWEHDGESRIHENLYGAISAGCLQRIATAIESVARDIAAMQDKQPNHNSYKLLKQVTKLSARLKAAGLDGDPKSDNRGRPCGKKTTGES